MANIGISKSLPKFLLPQLSWKTTPVSSSTIRVFSTSQQSHQSSTGRHGRNTSRSLTCRRQHGAADLRKSIFRFPEVRRDFHTTSRQARDHHFDTLKFVQRLREEGFTEPQSVAMMKVLSDVIEERWEC